MFFIYICYRDRDPVDDIARTVRRVRMALQDIPTAGHFSLSTQDHVCFMNLAGGRTKEGLAEMAC